MRKVTCFLFAAISILALSCQSRIEGDIVNVYTHRHYAVDQEIFALFTEETGIRVNVINASADELIQRMETEGENSPADLLITVDAGRLNRAHNKGLLQAFDSGQLTKLVPKQYRHPEGFWYGMTARARIIAYAKDRINADEIQDYAELANPKWRGRVLVRSSDNVYNQSLMASIIAADGEAKATAWANGLIANLAREPKGSDRDQVKAIASGEGDLTIVNTYYIGQLLNSDNEEERKAGESVGIIFPNQSNRGTHVNISGFGIAKHAKNKESAIKLAEFLLSETVQQKLAITNFEYPLNPNVEMANLLKQWGTFKRDSINLSSLGDFNDQAIKVFDAVGWN